MDHDDNRDVRAEPERRNHRRRLEEERRNRRRRRRREEVMEEWGVDGTWEYQYTRNV